MPKGRGKATVKDVMHKYKQGKLHSGSKKGPVVKDRKQAVAIGLSEAKESKLPASTKGKKREKRLEGKTL